MGKTPEEIREEIKAARDQMAAGVRGLSSEIHPSVIRQRSTQHMKDAVAARIKDAKELVVDESGVRWDRVGTIALASVAVITVLSALRGLVRWLRR